MTIRRQRIFALSVCAAAVAAFTAAARPARDADSPAEVARLRAHFDSVLQELRGADVSSLTASQRSARAELVARLEGYAAEGRFPHNHVRPGEFVPVFRDEHGTLCAMAYLIASTGRTDIVDRAAATNNLAYLPELARSDALRAWLDSVGLSVSEAARIQPAYCDREGWPPCIPEPPPAEAGLRAARREYGVTSAVATPFTAASMFLNLASRNASASRVRATTWLGVAVGTAQVAYGAVGTTHADSRRSIGIANVAVGGTAVASAIWRMRQPTRAVSRVSSLSVLPVVTSQDGVGLTLALRM